MNKNYSPKLLRNFLMKDFLHPALKTFFSRPKDFNDAWYGITGAPHGWARASELIHTHEIFNNDENIKSLDEKFYNELFYNVPDTSYIFPIINDQSTIMEAIQEFQALAPENLQINNFAGNANDFQLINIKVNTNTVNLLFRYGYSLNDDLKQVVFTISCIINLESNYLQINFRKDTRTRSGKKIPDVLSKVIDYIHTLNIITVNSYNPSLIKEKLYLMFKEESERADNIIKKRAGIKSIESKLQSAKDFLTSTFNVQETENEHYTKYLQRLMSIPFHQYALTMTDGNFGDRFMFAFSFYDGNTTRSTTRNSDKNHVYTGNLYWVLKDLINERGKLSSISMFYKITSSNFDLPEGYTDQFMEVNIKECTSLGKTNGCINIEFLQSKKRREPERRIKNEFLIQELGKFFPFKS